MRTNAIEFDRLRLTLGKGERLFEFAKLEFGQDTSIYLRVPASTGTFFYGREAIPAGQTSYTFNFAAQYQTSDPRLHLSIHQSGQVHARVRGRETSTTPALTVNYPQFFGAHAATVVADNLDALPESEHGAGLANGELAHPLYPDGDNSVKVSLYINGDAPKFDDECLFFLTLRREYLQPVFVGIRPINIDRLGQRGVSGVIAISGWRPGSALDTALDVVFVRGQ